MNNCIALFKNAVQVFLLLCVSTEIGCDLVTPQTNKPTLCISEGPNCWEMKNETRVSLTTQNWSLESCWDVQDKLLANQRFPVPASPTGADCAATLPTMGSSVTTMGSSATGRYRLWINSQSTLSARANQAIVVLIDNSNMMRQVLLRSQEQGNTAAQAAAGMTTQSVEFEAPTNFSLQLQLHAAPFETLEAGTWRISWVSVEPH